MFKYYKNKSLYGWVVFFMGVLSILVDAFMLNNMMQSIVVWVLLSIMAILQLKESYVQELVDTFKSKEFSKIFNFYIKCYFLSFALTLFLTTAITIFSYESSKDTPVGTIGFILFISISLAIYLLKRFNIYIIGICKDKGVKK